ncbi:predicted protein [Aspergillus terreus NIH2624]|uniref:Uncharacterized protein n=1 Tax=Aspergillus terreus (strain NIH 2624 / FGSC A1156) TaxID=341663 RepID=Q0CTV4_ASPTN|nr:uncharacterized protein ATEG_02880 [Aspergillus terreus NIH2624]EAU36154.1 predicted protein [Aspergillus terreus NIH2624]
MSCSTKALLLFVFFLATVQWGSTLKVAQTFYGFPDNDPAGPGILLDCGRGHEASGTGTFDDPLTFATAPGSFEDCEVIYDPTLKKYLIHEDYCQSCATEWTSGIWHIDVWVGQKNYNGAGDQINCENKLTSPPQKKGIGKQGSSAPNPPAASNPPVNPAPVNLPPAIPAPANPPANVPPINPPAANPPPANPPPASAPPAQAPPANVPPANPPPVNVPPVNIPPVNPPTVNIPPPSPPCPPSGNIPPASIPPAGAPPAAPPVKIPVSVPPPVNTPPPKLPPIIDPPVDDPPVTALSAKYATATDTAVQVSSTQDCVYPTSTEHDSQRESNDGQWAQASAEGRDNANGRYDMGRSD